jgi:hypothetical protein
MVWWQQWMNTTMVCINGCGVSRGYIAEEFELAESCSVCGTEMEGFRILTKGIK